MPGRIQYAKSSKENSLMYAFLDRGLMQFSILKLVYDLHMTATKSNDSGIATPSVTFDIHFPSKMSSGKICTYEIFEML